MEELPEELIGEILVRVDGLSLLSASQVARRWRQAALSKIPRVMTLDQFHEYCRRGQLFNVIHSKNSIITHTYTCRHYQLSGSIIEKITRIYDDFEDFNFDQCLELADEGGHVKLADWLLRQGAKISFRLMSFCRGGHLELAKGIYDGYSIEYSNEALFEASRYGHLEVVRWLITEKSAHYLNHAFKKACEGGHIDVAQYLFDLSPRYLGMGVDVTPDDLNLGLYTTCKAGHRDTAEWLIGRGAKDFNRGLSGACEGAHYSLIEWMIELGATTCKCNRSISEH